MPGEDSFDPRDWVAGPERPSGLPEAWRPLVAQDAMAPPPAPPRSARPVMSAARGNWLPYGVSLAVLLAGAGLAWTMRQAPQPLAPAETATAVLENPSPDIAAHSLSSRSLVVASPADIAGALTAAGVPAEEAAQASAAAAEGLGGATAEVRLVLDLLTSPAGTRLERLQASLPDSSGAVVSRGADGRFAATRVAAELSRQIKVVRGELDTHSFYSSAVAAGVIDSVIPEFVNAFSFDFDLQREIEPGDTFEVAYERTVNAQGEPVGQPQLLYAQLVTAQKRRALYRFTPAGQDVGWFDGNGSSTVRSLMRTPVDGARISSKFGFRLHPVLGYMKLHRGTDFAAPTGTPIYAAGDATVVWAAMKGANGNLTVLRHDNGWQTLYLHQSRFMPHVVPGARVRQGEKIGEVGTTGRSTGPHLHYEVHINGEAVDPQSVKTDSGRKGLEGATLAAFIQQRDRVDVARARQLH